MDTEILRSRFSRTQGLVRLGEGRKENSFNQKFCSHKFCVQSQNFLCKFIDLISVLVFPNPRIPEGKRGS